jgi:hypothetical protein
MGMGHSLYDSVRLLEHAPSGTRITWLVLATLRGADGVIDLTPDAIMACTGLRRVPLTAALTRLQELGLLVWEHGKQWRLTTDFTPVDTTPELPLDDPTRPPIAPATPPAAVTTPDDLVAIWNRFAPALHPIKKLTQGRRDKAWNRLRDNPDVDWSALCARLNASRFCRGENSAGWRAGFDFLLRESTVTKTLEGVYDDRPLSPVSLANAAAAATWLSARRKHV